jgi:hypothetical protein
MREQRETEADKLLHLVDEVAQLWEGEFDVVEDVRQMRKMRDDQLCLNKS